MITLIGLGVREGDLTLSAESALNNADLILVSSDGAEILKNPDGRKLTKLCAKDDGEAAKEVIKAAEGKNACFCVDGAVSESGACRKIIKMQKDVRIIEGVSRVSHVLDIAKLSCGQVTSVSACNVNSLKSCRAAVVYGIANARLAAEVKRVLGNLFGEKTACRLVCGDTVRDITVGGIDRQSKYSHACAVAVEEGEFLTKERYDFADLVHLVEILRAPGGCPWDRVQTDSSIKSNVVEEAYELEDAIERGDNDGILEETGDILLQAAFHSVLKEEQGVFTHMDATTANVKKLIFRHSHIFGKDAASSETEALGVWDKNKLREKHMTTFGESVNAVPKNLPACMRAQKVGKRAGKSGMDFLSPVAASEKIWEEVAEMVSAMQSEDKQATFDEAGDVLFAAVNCCRLAGVDCEEALRAATDKFARRFTECEKLIIADGKDITDLNELELDYYWVKAKNALAQG